MSDANFIHRFVSQNRVSIPSLACQLRVHPATVYRWVRHGVGGVRLRTNKVGGRTSVTAADFAEFMNRLNPEGRRA